MTPLNQHWAHAILQRELPRLAAAGEYVDPELAQRFGVVLPKPLRQHDELETLEPAKPERRPLTWKSRIERDFNGNRRVRVRIERLIDTNNEFVKTAVLACGHQVRYGLRQVINKPQSAVCPRCTAPGSERAQ